MTDKSKPEDLEDGALDAVQGGTAEIDFVEIAGGGQDGASHRASSHRRIQPVVVMKRVGQTVPVS